ncbi:protein kinase [Streptomyces sp. NPDC059895]|uniref:serine/threonine-protein kinase n=2 Tax=unclassified Streptomyces TaxID=2593676 RepID=UPI003662EFC1
MPEPLGGRVLAGRYRVDAPLGRGGAADVHEAFDLRLGRPVAVKLLRGGEAQAEKRFSDEALLLARLHHPGLVTVYDVGRDENLPFLVMQLVRGSTLRARIAAGRLTPAAVCALGADLATALAHVHAAGVVHRDVKPSNILLDEQDAPHLTDFGISRRIDDSARTATGVLVGTAAYLAPEQVTGDGTGPAVDVYALGLTLLECLKGELEYPGVPLEAAMARLHRRPAVPAGLDGELAGLAGLLEAMTAFDTCGRPDALTCARALTALETAATPAGRPSGQHRGGRRVGERAATAFRSRFGRPARAAGAGHRGPAVRRPGRRTPAAAGAALLAALLGVSLSGSAAAGSAAGDLPDHDADPGAGSAAAARESVPAVPSSRTSVSRGGDGASEPAPGNRRTAGDRVPDTRTRTPGPAPAHTARTRPAAEKGRPAGGAETPRGQVPRQGHGQGR